MAYMKSYLTKTCAVALVLVFGFLILDVAEAGLDPRSQAMIDQALKDFEAGKYGLPEEYGTSPLSTINGSTPVSIDANPRFPQPLALVTLQLNDYAISSVGSEVTWSVDGVAQGSAQNQRSIQVVAPKLGETKVVTVQVRLRGGSVMTAEHKISPVRTDIVVDADSVVPVFYKGSALPSIQTPIRATAILYDGSGTNPNDYSYVWKMQNQVIGGGQIRGGNTITFTPPLRRSVSLTVEISDLAGKPVGRKTVEVPIVEAEVLFYEFNPLRGINQNAVLKTYPMLTDEVTFKAETYHLPKSVIVSRPKVAWELNRRAVDNGGATPYEITIRRQSGAGAYTIGLDIRSMEQILSGARGSFQVTF